MKPAIALVVMVFGMFARSQDAPQDIRKNELPKKAPCIVCAAGGEAHGEEKPAAGVRYKGKSYYLCNAGEVSRFKADPEAFIPPVLPRPAPALAAKNLDGEAVNLADFKGKVVLLDFWATWCAPCVAAMPDIDRLHKKLAERGFTALGVSIDEGGAKVVRPFIEKKKFTYPILLDEFKAWKSWHVQSIPAMFLIDKSGQIVRQWVGKVDKAGLEKSVTDLLK